MAKLFLKFMSLYVHIEPTVKVQDGRGINGHFRVFYAGTKTMESMEYTVTVTDTTTGEV